MGDKTKIDWCDASWNPVTGCKHGCEYCYARKIAERFGGYKETGNMLEELNEPFRERSFDYSENILHESAAFPYPYNFKPTLHRYRLGIPARWAKPRNIFVCSMSDLFGEWVPDEWIQEVFEACEAAPQHKYLFLTKNPDRYISLAKRGLLVSKENFWYGYSATNENMLWRFKHADECPCLNLFVSIEPIHGPITSAFCTHVPADWIIVGAETGRRKDKVIPEKKWIDDLLTQCSYSGRPIFMKESLRELMGDDFRQEYPWDARW